MSNRRQIKRCKRSKSLPTYLYEHQRPLRVDIALGSTDSFLSITPSSELSLQSSVHQSEVDTLATERTASSSSRKSKRSIAEASACAQLAFSLREFISTEHDYLGCLNDLVQVYMAQLQTEVDRGIRLEDYNLIARNIDEILYVHQDVWDIVFHACRHLTIAISTPLQDNLLYGISYGQLQQLAHCICQDLWQLSDQLQVYGPYCAGQAVAQRTLSRLDRKLDWSKFEQKCQHQIVSNNNIMRRLTLKDYLIMPIQRICRYPLLFQEILKCCPMGTPVQYAVELVLHTFRDIIDETNTHTRHADDIRIAHVIAERLDPTSKVATKGFVQSLGIVILSGALRIIRFSLADQTAVVERYFAVFIYAEYIVMADVRRRDLYEPVVCISMHDPAVLIDKVGQPLGSLDGMPAYSFRIYRHEEAFQLTASCLDEYEVWLNAIQFCAANRKEELYMERREYQSYVNDGCDAMPNLKQPRAPYSPKKPQMAPYGLPSRFWLYPRQAKASNAIPSKFVREAEVEAVHLKLRDVLSMKFVTACARPDYKDRVARKLVRKKSADAVMTLRPNMGNGEPHNKSADSLPLLNCTADSMTTPAKGMRLHVVTDVPLSAKRSSMLQTPATMSTSSETSSQAACVTPPSSSLMATMRSIFNQTGAVSSNSNGSTELPLSPCSQDYVSPRCAHDGGSRASSPQAVRSPARSIKRFWSGTK